MADPTIFSFQELITLMVKAKDIHEGHWALHVQFGLSALNLKAGPSPEDAVLRPTAVVPMLGIGISQIQEPHELSVDASKVNPATKHRKRRAKTS